jgi:hypothetical protein
LLVVSVLVGFVSEPKPTKVYSTQLAIREYMEWLGTTEVTFNKPDHTILSSTQEYYRSVSHILDH